MPENNKEKQIDSRIFSFALIRKDKALTAAAACKLEGRLKAKARIDVGSPAAPLKFRTGNAANGSCRGEIIGKPGD